MNLSAKYISFFNRKNASKLAIFESKMDYAAVYQSFDFSDFNVLRDSFYNTTIIFQQNDSQGHEFTHEIVILKA